MPVSGRQERGRGSQRASDCDSPASQQSSKQATKAASTSDLTDESDRARPINFICNPSTVQDREQIRSRVDWSIYSHFQLVPLKPAFPNSTQSFSSLSRFHISVLLPIPFVIVSPAGCSCACIHFWFPSSRGLTWWSPRLSPIFPSSIPPHTTPR